MNNINLDYYKIFYYVAKLGGITAASKQLCTSQPAISQSIKQLEKQLGGILFIRTPKGVKLTPEGKNLYSYVQKGYETILLGEENFKKLTDLENGEIRIGASDMTLKYFLLPYLQSFHEKYVKIKVHVTNVPTPETMQNLIDGRIDFGIVTSPISKKNGLIVREVKKIQDIFVAGSKYMALKHRTVPYKELESLPIICLEKDTSTRAYMDSHLSKNGVSLKPEFELATSDMIVSFALRNLGVGCVVREFAQPYLDRKELFELLLEKKIPKRNICIVTAQNNPISTAAKKLLEMMEEI